MLTQPLAAVVASGQVEPGGRVIVDVGEDGSTLSLRLEQPAERPVSAPQTPMVLILDDNSDLLSLIKRGLAEVRVTLATATTVQEARGIAANPIDLAVIDQMLPDGDGLSMAFELLRRWPNIHIVMMTGGTLSDDEIAVCERQEFPVLQKPFLVEDVVRLVKSGVMRSSAAGS
jgi:DNA-binding response OmpR family regulator